MPHTSAHIVCNKRRFELLLQLILLRAFLPRELLLLHLCIFECIYVSFINSICYPLWWEEAAVWWAPGFSTFYGHAKSVEGNVGVAVLWAEGLLRDLQAWTRLYCLVYPRHLKKKHTNILSVCFIQLSLFFGYLFNTFVKYWECVEMYPRSCPHLDVLVVEGYWYKLREPLAKPHGDIPVHVNSKRLVAFL